jgi:hypothetical protein
MSGTTTTKPREASVVASSVWYAPFALAPWITPTSG